MHPSDSAITKLAAAARRAPGAEHPLPFGFATRVLSRIAAESAALAWERLGWRSLACACVVLAGCLLWDAAAAPPAEDDFFITELTAAAFQP